MHAERITQLLKFLEAEPNDPFLLYALATEYNKSEPQKALAFYEKLLNEHPDYLPTYYHAAALYAELELQEKAGKTYQKGIEKARHAADHHALRELQAAYTNWQFEQDDLL
jgi:tetratricopeptide (TPR) repeat protein